MTTIQPDPTPDVPATRPAEAGFSCLLVEDDRGFADMLRAVIAEEGGEVTHSATLAQAREAVNRRSFDLAVLDNHLPDGKGFDFYFELSRRDPSQTVIVLTGLPELAHAVELTRGGLFDYLAKPIDREAFTACLRRARLRWSRLRVNLKGDDLVASSPAMREVALALEQASRHPTATVLFTGETGSGKDAAARRLHRLTHGSRSDATPFVPVNCAAVPAEMFEAELFGAERGAYTGADKTREGLAGATRDGTLFLDEIGEVPLAIQAKLLRFLEAREYRPLGGSAVKRFQGRLVAATNRVLREDVSQGRFREDLLYRLDVFAIHLPPLRERPDEIPALAETLLRQLGGKYDRVAPRLRQDDLSLLAAYAFPGNVRELRNVLERSLLRTPPDSGWLALDRAWLNRGPATAPAVAAPRDATPNGAAVQAAGRDLPPLEAREYEAIREALMASQGGIRRAAARLGITHQALLRRLEKWPELRQSGAAPSSP